MWTINLDLVFVLFALVVLCMGSIIGELRARTSLVTFEGQKSIKNFRGWEGNGVGVGERGNWMSCSYRTIFSEKSREKVT